MLMVFFRAILLAIFIALAGCNPSCDVSDWPKAPFSSSAWSSADSRERYKYVRDLIDKHIQQGNSKQHVYTLLGRPDYEAMDGSYVTYVIAHPSNFLSCYFNSIAILHIDFDAKGLVITSYVRFD